MPIIYGNAGTPSVLDVARIDQASTVVFAMDDSLAIRQGVQHALHRNERLHIVARAHSAQEEGALRRMGVARVITAERELGNELVRHTLWRYGVSEREIDAILRRRLAVSRPARPPRCGRRARPAISTTSAGVAAPACWIRPHGPRRTQTARMPAAAGRDDVVVDSIAGVGDPSRIGIAGHLQHARKECGVRLGDAHLVGHGHHFGLDPQGPQLGRAAGRLVGHEPDVVAELPVRPSIARRASG